MTETRQQNTIASTDNPPRSLFVSIVSWMFIALTAYSTLKGIQEISKTLTLAFVRFDRYLQPGISLVALVSAIGLLLRKDWARKIFIVFLFVCIIWNVYVSIYAKLAYKAQFPLYSLSVIFITVLFFAWVIYRLCSKTIKSEFIRSEEWNHKEITNA